MDGNHEAVMVTGGDARVTELRAECIGHAARLLHCPLAPAQRQVSAPVLDLAEAVMAAGVACAEDQSSLGMLKRYLSSLLKALSSHTAGADRCAGSSQPECATHWDSSGAYTGQVGSGEGGKPRVLFQQ